MIRHMGVDGNGVTMAEILSQPVECRSQAQFIQEGWPKVCRNLSDGGNGGIEPGVHGGGLTATAGGGALPAQIVLQHDEVHFQGAQTLADVVMQFPGHLPFLLLPGGEDAVREGLQFFPRVTQPCFGAHALRDVAQHDGE
ncbi:hypothetical protein D3C86_1873000 [compost metagenome]